MKWMRAIAAFFGLVAFASSVGAIWADDMVLSTKLINTAWLTFMSALICGFIAFMMYLDEDTK